MCEFVPLRIAKKLKEKGFKEPCFGWYYPSEICGYDYRTLIVFNRSRYRGDRHKDLLILHDDKYIDAPTIEQVLKWLREALEIDILPKIVISWCGNLNRIRSYSCNIYSPRLNKPIETEYFESYEEAALAGIEYVLNNLI